MSADGGQLHVEFRACCWDCGYEAEVKMSASLGGSRPKERS